jgi:hypothetical protein
MESRKAAIKNFNQNVDPAILKLIKPVSEHPAMIEADRKMAGLKNQLKEITDRIGRINTGEESIPNSPQALARQNASGILAGVSVETLPRETRDELLKKLLRQRLAIESAINLQQTEIQTLTSRISREAFENEQFRKYYFEEIIKPQIDFYEKIIQLLQKIEVNSQFLSRCGYPENMRPSEFSSNNYSQMLLFGGNFGNLQGHIDWLEKTWGLDTDTK